MLTIDSSSGAASAGILVNKNDLVRAEYLLVEVMLRKSTALSTADNRSGGI